jgi:hypothetical protein
MVLDECPRYYDLLYSDKDYPGEVDYVLDRIKRCGVDLNEPMIRIAQSKVSEHPLAGGGHLSV